MKKKNPNRKQESEILNHTFLNKIKETPKETPQRKKREKKLPVILGTLCVLFLMGCIGSWYVFASPLQSHNRILPSDTMNNTQILSAQNEDGYIGDMWSQNRINILLIGTDTRPGESELSSNTDSLILASVDTKNQRIEMLSIPRDSRVEIPGHGKGKINTALPIGGITLTEQLVADLVGQPIDYYAIAKFGGLKGIVDTVGGVTMNVDRNMYYNTGDTEDNIINLKKGLQNLNGSQALGYVRFREDALGDIQRTMRQQVFLQALKEKLLSVQEVPKLPSIVRQFWNMFNTNLPQSDAMKLATRAELFAKQPVIHETLPGSFETINGVSYWQVNPTEAMYVANQFFTNGKVIQNPVQNINETINWHPPLVTLQETVKNTSPKDHSDTTANSDPNSQTYPSNQSSSHSMTGDAIAQAPLNVRSGPSTSFRILTSLTIGQQVTILEQIGNWDKIQLSNGTIGYVASSYLK